MELIWADECDRPAGSPPQSVLWGLRQTDCWQPADELQTYTRDRANAQHDGHGHLVVRAIRQPDGTYTSARLSARHATRPWTFHYGRFAARIKVPTGVGIWPAWWLLGRDDRYGWPACGEIDIMEAPVGPATSGEVHQGTHSPAADGGGAVGVGVDPSTGDWGTGFHVYALDWAPGRLEFFVDDRSTGVVTATDVAARGGAWPFDQRAQSPMLTLAVGGWAGPPGGWSTQEMLIDWVRVWA
jgi:beta-glucanase (GH16 family)